MINTKNLNGFELNAVIIHQTLKNASITGLLKEKHQMEPKDAINFVEEMRNYLTKFIEMRQTMVWPKTEMYIDYMV